MKAVKGNREYNIDESQQKHYQDAGFDIMEDGKIIAHGRGKTVPYSDYMSLAAELDAAKADQEAVKAERDALAAELDAVKVDQDAEARKQKKG